MKSTSTGREKTNYVEDANTNSISEVSAGGTANAKATEGTRDAGSAEAPAASSSSTSKSVSID